ncbi:MAG TPA: M1 family aminopeptidase, partial [Daejeonella sp.]|nr:M1 family aminopeptidase [Daejeonella sp.]
GSFIRISNYFPDLGYDENNDITNSIERKMRGMKAQDPLPSLESETDDPFDHQFIDLQAVISTDGDQQAIGQGVLEKQWRQGGRNYFRYTTDRPIPFRFAVSSARYKVLKDRFRNIAIEIYYHPDHPENVSHLLKQAKQTIAYCEQNYGPYPHPLIRFAEVSAFAEGFAATAYPTTIYMKENGGFHTKLDADQGNDVINQLAGHELSHAWWGSVQMAPEIKEGGWLMTETLAKYTELMLLRQSQGDTGVRTQVLQHLDAYASVRSFSTETPLYKTTYETPHLPYDKGTVVMYQLYQLIGEKAINQALNNLLRKFAYPNTPPDTEDLLAELYRVSPLKLHPKIDKLFKKIITYDLKIGKAEATKNSEGYGVTFAASISQYTQDGRGSRKAVRMDEDIEVLVETASGKTILQSFRPENGRLHGFLLLNELPVKVILDPYIKLMDVFQEDNEITLSGF